MKARFNRHSSANRRSLVIPYSHPSRAILNSTAGSTPGCPVWL